MYTRKNELFKGSATWFTLYLIEQSPICIFLRSLPVRKRAGPQASLMNAGHTYVYIHVFFFVRCLRKRGRASLGPRGKPLNWEVQNFPPREGPRGF